MILLNLLLLPAALQLLLSLRVEYSILMGRHSKVVSEQRLLHFGLPIRIKLAALRPSVVHIIRKVAIPWIWILLKFCHRTAHAIPIFWRKLLRKVYLCVRLQTFGLLALMRVFEFSRLILRKYIVIKQIWILTIYLIVLIHL